MHTTQAPTGLANTPPLCNWEEQTHRNSLTNRLLSEYGRLAPDTPKPHAWFQTIYAELDQLSTHQLQARLQCLITARNGLV